jgi:hypothetical protein
MLEEGKRKREGLAYPLHACVNRPVQFGKLFVLEQDPGLCSAGFLLWQAISR